MNGLSVMRVSSHNKDLTAIYRTHNILEPKNMDKKIFSDGRWYWIMTEHGPIEIQASEADRLIFKKGWLGQQAKIPAEIDPLQDL